VSAPRKAERSDAFGYRTTKDGKVFITWKGSRVMTLAGAKADSFLIRMDGISEESAQLVMAKVTGNFRRGNER